MLSWANVLILKCQKVKRLYKDYEADLFGFIALSSADEMLGLGLAYGLV